MDYHKIYNKHNFSPFYMLYENQTAELKMRDIQKNYTKIIQMIKLKKNKQNSLK